MYKEIPSLVCDSAIIVDLKEIVIASPAGGR